MNTLIAAIVGSVAAAAVMVGGVNYVANDTPEPVAQSELYTYSSR